jgi:hypothetical protein
MSDLHSDNQIEQVLERMLVDLVPMPILEKAKRLPAPLYIRRPSQTGAA